MHLVPKYRIQGYADPEAIRLYYCTEFITVWLKPMNPLHKRVDVVVMEDMEVAGESLPTLHNFDRNSLFDIESYNDDPGDNGGI
jgi:hypothetical protein